MSPSGGEKGQPEERGWGLPPGWSLLAGLAASTHACLSCHAFMPWKSSWDVCLCWCSWLLQASAGCLTAGSTEMCWGTFRGNNFSSEIMTWQEHFLSSIQAFGIRPMGDSGWWSASEWGFKGTSGGEWELVCEEQRLSHGRGQADGMGLLCEDPGP